jgi:hypothetical protein
MKKHMADGILSNSKITPKERRAQVVIMIAAERSDVSSWTWIVTMNTAG